MSQSQATLFHQQPVLLQSTINLVAVYFVSVTASPIMASPISLAASHRSATSTVSVHSSLSAASPNVVYSVSVLSYSFSLTAGPVLAHSIYPVSSKSCLSSFNSIASHFVAAYSVSSPVSLVTVHSIPHSVLSAEIPITAHSMSSARSPIKFHLQLVLRCQLFHLHWALHLCFCFCRLCLIICHT